jgi:hypothetical protein
MNKIVIVVKDLVKGTSTNSEALPLFHAIDSAFGLNKTVTLSLKDCSAMSSSFLNSSIGEIIEKYGIDNLKGRLSIIDYTPVTAKIFKNYIESCKKLDVNL